jgi:hypothetical protein
VVDAYVLWSLEDSPSRFQSHSEHLAALPWKSYAILPTGVKCCNSNLDARVGSPVKLLSSANSLEFQFQ